ncbi:MAG: flagellin lysine-N-methylase [Clostridiales bacterium]|nr:flagellin lysine-N-methylase [Candidatus Cacconaster stercorequi]
MKICRPVQDMVFRCLADGCPDTCCAGWEIPVDEESAARWQKLPPEWRDRMVEATEWSSGERQLKRHHGRCVLLNERNLCELYAACGIDALCRTCHLHPRFVAEYGGLREIMPGLSCPAWAELYLMSDEKVTFITEESDELPAYNEIDASLFYRLKKAREKAFDLLQDRSIPLDKRIDALLALAEATDGVSERGDVPQSVLSAYIRKLRQLEILTPQWRELLQRSHPSVPQPWRETVGERLLIYYVFRFWLRGVYSGKVLPWAKLAVWSCISAFALAADCETREEFCEVIRLYSKEIEHNTENVDALYRVLCRHSGRYSVAGLLKAWEKIK